MTGDSSWECICTVCVFRNRWHKLDWGQNGSRRRGCGNLRCQGPTNNPADRLGQRVLEVIQVEGIRKPLNLLLGFAPES